MGEWPSRECRGQRTVSSHVAGRADVNGWGAAGRGVIVGLAGDNICQAACCVAVSV